MQEQVGNFFRVFDLAFFAPGVVLFGAIAKANGIPQVDLSNLNLNDATTSILMLILVIGGIYVLGLFCHALQRLLRALLQSRSDSESTLANLKQRIEAANQLSDLYLYFWYMRATSWNLAVALTLSSIIIVFPGILSYAWLLWVLLTFGLALLIYLGFDFINAVNSGDKHLHQKASKGKK